MYCLGLVIEAILKQCVQYVARLAKPHTQFIQMCAVACCVACINHFLRCQLLIFAEKHALVVQPWSSDIVFTQIVVGLMTSLMSSALLKSRQICYVYNHLLVCIVILHLYRFVPEAYHDVLFPGVIIVLCYIPLHIKSIHQWRISWDSMDVRPPPSLVPNITVTSNTSSSSCSGEEENTETSCCEQEDNNEPETCYSD